MGKADAAAAAEYWEGVKTRRNEMMRGGCRKQMRRNNALLQSHRIVRGVLICSPAQWIAGDIVPCLSLSRRETTAAFPPPTLLQLKAKKRSERT